MIEFVITGDPHLAIDVQVPAGRHPDTFYQEQRDKLNFIKQYGKDNQITNLILPGDILNYKAPTLYTAASINSLIKEFKNLREQYTIYSISGNHDMKFSSRDLKQESVYNIFVQGHMLTDLNKKTFDLTDTVTLSGIDYNPSKETLLTEVENLNSSLTKDKINILVLHEHLLPDGESLRFGEYLNYSEFTRFDKIDIIISGHLHKGYPTQIVEPVDIDSDTPQHKQIFINPWSLSRLSRDNYALDATHTPELVHLTISDDKQITFKHVIIPHKSPEEAFIKDSLKDESNQTLDISEFVSSLTNANIEAAKVTDLETQPTQVKEKIEYYLELAEKENA